MEEEYNHTYPNVNNYPPFMNPVSLTLLIHSTLFTQEISHKSLQVHEYSPWRMSTKAISKVKVSWPVENTVCLSFLQLSCEMSALRVQAIVTVTEYSKESQPLRYLRALTIFWGIQFVITGSEFKINTKHPTWVNHNFTDRLIHTRKKSAFEETR